MALHRERRFQKRDQWQLPSGRLVIVLPSGRVIADRRMHYAVMERARYRLEGFFDRLARLVARRDSEWFYENANVKASFGTKTVIATTALTSLANGSGWQSTVIDNTANLFLDAMLRIQTNGQASGTGLVDFYSYSALGDTTYTDGASGSDSAFTAANRRNSAYIGSVQMNAATAVKAGNWGVGARGYHGILPDKWGIIAINNSGAAMSATAGDHLIEFEGVFQTVI